MIIKNRAVVFYNLNPLNYLPALFIRILCRVVFWRRSFLPLFLVKPFEQLYLHGSFTQGEWVEVTVPIFFKLKKQMQKERFHHRINVKYNGLSIDLTMAAMQVVVNQYRRVYHFYRLLDYWLNRQKKDVKFKVIDFKNRRYLKNLGLSVNSGEIQFVFFINYILELIWEYIYNFLKFCLIFLRVLKSMFLNYTPFQKINIKNIKYFFYCYNHIDIASKENSLDATSLVKRKLLNSDESLFVFSREPNSLQIKWLSKGLIKWVTYKSLFWHLPKIKRINTLLWIFKNVFIPRQIIGKNELTNFIKYPLLNNIFIFEYFMHVNAKILISSNSEGVEENPIISLARGLKKKTVRWVSAGTGSKHIPNTLPFKYSNEQVEESLTQSEEKWIWCEADKNMLIKRSLTPSKELGTTFKVIGPMMLGDSSWIYKSPLQARKEFNFTGNSLCKIWISIFDFSPFQIYARTESRWPIVSYTNKMLNAFFKDIHEILTLFPDIGIIYKPKRDDKDKSLPVVQELLNLFDINNQFVKERRIVKLSHNIDPYIPIALCNYAIGMSYTSALLAVLASNRMGYYYDATSYIDKTYPNELNSITILGRDKLHYKIQSWIEEKDNKVKEPFKKLFGCKGDPGENFIKRLKEIT